jgi:hypothetical protein
MPSRTAKRQRAIAFGVFATDATVGLARAGCHRFGRSPAALPRGVATVALPLGKVRKSPCAAPNSAIGFRPIRPLPTPTVVAALVGKSSVSPPFAYGNAPIFASKMAKCFSAEATRMRAVLSLMPSNSAISDRTVRPKSATPTEGANVREVAAPPVHPVPPILLARQRLNVPQRKSLVFLAFRFQRFNRHSSPACAAIGAPD